MKKNLLVKYENQWVALSSDYSKVIEHDKEVENLEKKLTKQKIKNVTLMKVLPFDYIIAP